MILLWSDRGVSGLAVNALRDSGLRSVIKYRATELLPRDELYVYLLPTIGVPSKPTNDSVLNQCLPELPELRPGFVG